MKMTDSQTIPAPQAAVWAALNDPEVLKQCIPGCESLEKTSDNEMVAAVVLKVGPVKAKFGGKVTLSDLDPPNGYRITGEGSGGVAGFAKGGATVRLEAAGPDATVLHYDVDAQVGGKIAQLGARLIDSTAKRLAGEFFEKFAATLSPEAAAPAAAPEGAEAAEGETAEAAGEPAKKGWLGGLFSKGNTAPMIALMLAGGLLAHACCIGHGAAEAHVLAGVPICGVGPAA